MYLIPVPALTDNAPCLLHGSKHVRVMNRVNAGSPMAARNARGPDPESILVKHHQGGYPTSIPPGNGQYVRTVRPYVAGVRERLLTRTSRMFVNPIIAVSQPRAASDPGPAPP